MSTKPRTPEHFPRMKWRAAGRMRQTSALVSWLDRWVRTAAATYARALDRIVLDTQREADYALTAQPAPTTTGEWTEHLYDRDRFGANKPMPENGWQDLATLEWLARHAAEPLPTKIAETDPHRFRINHVRDVVQVWTDPTHGTVDLDVQIAVDQMRPGSVGQRVALERTAQDRKDAGQPW